METTVMIAMRRMRIFGWGFERGPAGAGRSPGAAERSGGAIWRRAGGKLREGGSRRRPAAIELGAYLVRAGRQDVKRGVVMELLALVGFLFVLALASYFFGADSRKFDRPNWW